MKKTTALAIILAVVFLTMSCTKKDGTDSDLETVTSTEKDHPSIGFSIDTLAIERWRRDCDIFLNTAKESGTEVIVQNAGNSIDEQIKQIQYLIKRKVKVIVIVAKNAESLTDVIKSAKSHNIKVISYDRLILNSDIDLYLSIDSQKVGEYMASTMMTMRPVGTWYCIFGPQEDYNMTLIRQGIEKVISGKPVSIGYIYYTDGWNYDLSYRKMIELLQANMVPDAVLCGNDALANSVIQAISEMRPTKHITVAGQDADIAACQNIVEGRQAITIYKPITELARKAADCAAKMAEGIPVEKIVDVSQTINNRYGDIPVIWLEPVAVTKENINEIVIKSDYHTYNEVYRK